MNNDTNKEKKNLSLFNLTRIAFSFKDPLTGHPKKLYNETPAETYKRQRKKTESVKLL